MDATVGTGIERVFDTCRSEGLPRPSFVEDRSPDRVCVMLFTEDVVPSSEEESIMDLEGTILQTIGEDDSITMADIPKGTRKSTATVSGAIARLWDPGHPDRKGGAHGRWILL